MPIRGAVSTLSDQRYIAALEAELEAIKDELAELRQAVQEVRSGGY